MAPAGAPTTELVTGNAGFIGFHTAKRLLEPGDVSHTHDDFTDLERAVSYKPATPVKEGVANFAAW